MAQFKQWFDQDLTENIVVRHCESVMFTGDDKGALVGVRLFDDGVAYSGGGTVTGAVKRSDGGLVALTGTLSGNAASVVIPAAALAYPGPIGVHIVLTQGGSVTTVLKAIYSVDDNSGAAVDPGTIIPSINDLITAINTAVASIPSDYSALLHTLAPDFSASTAYVAGYYVWYNGVLYRFTSNHAAGSWTGTDVQTAVVGNDLSVLRDILTTDTISSNFEVSGGIRASTGATIPGTTRLTSNSFIYPSEFFSVRAINGYVFSVYAWDGDEYIGSYRNGSFLKEIGAEALTDFAFINYGQYKFKLSFYKQGASQITLEEAQNALFCAVNPDIVKTDKTLLTQDMAADAEAVGNALYAGRDRIRTSTMPLAYYSLANLSPFNVTEMPQSTYTYIHYSVISDSLAGTNMPDNDWEDNDFVYCISYGLGRSTTQSRLIQLYNTTKKRYLTLIYISGVSSPYRWVINSGGGTTIEQTINQYENTYNVTATPSITTDTNNYLQPTGDQTDMAAAIVTMLTQTGVCNLAPGTFYVSGIDMPDSSSIIGSGIKTNVILIPSITTGYAIKMGSRCLVEDLTISGSTSVPEITSEFGGRNGIVWQGTAIPGQSTSSATPLRGLISNCHIRRFNGSGIYCYGTGVGISNCLNVSNVYVYECTAGINIEWLSEFHRFSNVDCRGCYYGIINNGGNNTFANCGFSKNMAGLLMDNSLGQSTNNSHGSFTNCVFNHNADNDGVAIEIIGCGSGEMFTGCQVFFGEIKITDSKGMVFSGCNIKGHEEDERKTKITIAGGGLVMFNACNFGAGKPKIKITNNVATHFINCYTNDGVVVTEDDAN